MTKFSEPAPTLFYCRVCRSQGLRVAISNRLCWFCRRRSLRTECILSAKWGSRGKIQYSYRPGLIASASRMRQTVLGLMALPRAVEDLAARSADDSRLKGSWVWLTASQAMALTTAWSRRGKIGLSPASGLVRQ
jgi:hypothetical protein